MSENEVLARLRLRLQIEEANPDVAPGHDAAYMGWRVAFEHVLNVIDEMERTLGMPSSSRELCGAEQLMRPGGTYLCWRSPHDSGAHFNPHLRPAWGTNVHGWRTDGCCPVHGIPDCSAQLNGCTLLTRRTR